ncbi:guanylate kinase [Kitasatospora sp. NPDC056181]|uniref:phosphotransferase-like protein n=1 Tax=Kitasatospora sp. NPDC056181 TaxID=3345737 RepID=UPI0035E1DC4A
MTARGLILYGPPAAGKDTVTRALQELGDYRLFSRLKVGAGKSEGYRMGTSQQLADLEVAGDVIYQNSRYGNTYVIDRPGMDAAFEAGTPIVHLGQIDGIAALVAGYPADWAAVLLWCGREVTAVRSAGRGDSDTEARVRAWDATHADVESHPDQAWDLSVDTSTVEPVAAARLIDALLSAGGQRR